MGYIKQIAEISGRMSKLYSKVGTRKKCVEVDENIMSKLKRISIFISLLCVTIIVVCAMNFEPVYAADDDEFSEYTSEYTIDRSVMTTIEENATPMSEAEGELPEVAAELEYETKEANEDDAETGIITEIIDDEDESSNSEENDNVNSDAIDDLKNIENTAGEKTEDSEESEQVNVDNASTDKDEDIDKNTDKAKDTDKDKDKELIQVKENPKDDFSGDYKLSGETSEPPKEGDVISAPQSISKESVTETTAYPEVSEVAISAETAASTETEEEYIVATTVIDLPQGNRVHFYNIAGGAYNGDCIFVESDGHWGMIDTGHRYQDTIEDSDGMIYDAPRSRGLSSQTPYKYGKAAMEFMIKTFGITHLDFIIGTHAHSDHIGGGAGNCNYQGTEFCR